MTYRRAEGAQGTQLMPGLAESKPEALEGGTAFRFTLRKGLTYSDGRPVLAADVAARHPAVAGAEPGGAPRAGGHRGHRGRRARAHRAHPAGDARPGVPRPADHAVDRAGAAGHPDPRPARARRWRAWGPTGWRPATRGRSYVLTRRRDFRLPGIPAGNVDSVAGTVVPSRSRRTSQTLGRAAWT